MVGWTGTATLVDQPAVKAMNRIRPLRVRTARTGLVLALILTAAGQALAQGDTRITLGVGAYTLSDSGSDPENFDPVVRLVAGVGVSFPFRSGISVRPELRYLTRGAAFDGTLADRDVDVVLELTTLDLGLMAGFDVPLGGQLQPRVFAGPILGWTAESSVRYRAKTGGSWVNDSYSEVRRFDTAIGFGAEVGFPVGGAGMLVGVRGVLGLSGIIEDQPAGSATPDWRHRGIDVYLGLGL